MPHASPAESTAPARINPPASPVAVTEHVPDATLIPLLYKELRRLAAAKIAAERVGHTLTATALVNEAYLRLHGTSAHESGWQSKAHFFGAAAEAMKRVLIDHAERKNAQKRGGGRRRESPDALDGLASVLPTPPVDILALNEALEKLRDTDPQGYRVVMLRFFAGLGVQEVAAMMGVCERTVKRVWRGAQV